MFLKYFKNLFFPQICVGCNAILLEKEDTLCTICIHDLPIIHINNSFANEIKATFTGLVSVNEVVSFLYFTKQGITQKLIHQLKYKNNQNIGVFLGNWFANLLKEKGCLATIDYIVPVPLHKNRLKQRGYNQVTTFCLALSEVLEVTYQPNILKRIAFVKTQTNKGRYDRFSSIKNQFKVDNKQYFKNKHILLVDDVITTGATLEACCNALLTIENIKISIATIAYTQQT